MGRIVFSFILLFAIAPLAQARVVRVEIKTREDCNGGKPFGLAGPYERLIGKVYFKVDPHNPHNTVIVDRSKGVISKQPPAVGTPYPAFVPQVNADGNVF